MLRCSTSYFKISITNYFYIIGNTYIRKINHTHSKNYHTKPLTISSNLYLSLDVADRKIYCVFYIV